MDAELVASGVSTKLLETMIARHRQDLFRLQRLQQYYLGQHDIAGRQTTAGLPNNRLICNYARYITDMAVGYLFGVPVSYSASAGVELAPIIDEYTGQTIPGLDAELARQTSIYGLGYELVYANAEASPRSVDVLPQNIFLVCDDTVEHNKLFAVHYFARYKDGDGAELAGYEISVYTHTHIHAYFSPGPTCADFQDRGATPHYFGQVPVIEYRNNNDGQGDFEQVIPLIDAYNKLQSDRVNDKEQLVDALLVLYGASLPPEKIAQLKRHRMLKMPKDGKAEYLVKQLNENQVQVLRDCISEDIHKFSMVPNLTDENFAGNASGVAIRYKLLALSQLAATKERYFQRGLRQRLAMYSAFLQMKQNIAPVDAARVDVVFGRNLPANESEIAQMVTGLRGLVSDETLLAQLPFVEDSAEEEALVKKQEQQRTQAAGEVSRMVAGLRGLVSDKTLLAQLPFVQDPAKEASLLLKQEQNRMKDAAEISQMVANLRGFISDETLLAQVPFVQDPDKEKLLLKRQQKKQAEQALEQAAREAGAAASAEAAVGRSAQGEAAAGERPKQRSESPADFVASADPEATRQSAASAREDRPPLDAADEQKANPRAKDPAAEDERDAPQGIQNRLLANRAPDEAQQAQAQEETQEDERERKKRGKRGRNPFAR